MTEKLICPVCEAGTLTAHIYSAEFEHTEGPVTVAGLECYQCDECDADPIMEDQIKRNHITITDAKRRASGLLTGGKIKEFRKELGLTQHQAAELFGGGQNAFSKYERGDVAQSNSMDRLIRCAREFPFLVDYLANEAGLKDWVVRSKNE